MLSFRLVLCFASMLAPGAALAADGRIDIPLEKKPFTTFHYEMEWDKPFLYPLRTASGTVITRKYPFEKNVAGERQDHPWHRGIWFGHGDINGIDFWRELGEGKTGRTEIKFPPKVELADRSALVSADFRLIGPDGTAIVGSVRQEFQITRLDGNNVIDAHFTVSADQGTALKMGDTEEGTFGIRLADEFREDRGAVLMNSDGLVGANKIWGKPAKWVDYSSTVGGEKCGVAVLDHPSNPKHPTFWHARNYALNAANPFGEHDFFKDPKRDGGMTIPAGGKMEFRYRVVIHPGDAKSAGIENLYDEFAKGRK